MYDLLRLADRYCNQYPHLHYPEMYILDQGYNKFFETQGAVSFLLKKFSMYFINFSNSNGRSLHHVKYIELFVFKKVVR